MEKKTNKHFGLHLFSCRQARPLQAARSLIKSFIHFTWGGFFFFFLPPDTSCPTNEFKQCMIDGRNKMAAKQQPHMGALTGSDLFYVVGL